MRWGVVWGCVAAGVAVLSLLPAREYPRLLAAVNDKAGHALAYLVLAGIPSLFFERWKWGAVAAALGMGVALEVLQMMVPGRSFEWMDVASNTVGVGAGVVVGWVVGRVRK